MPGAPLLASFARSGKVQNATNPIVIPSEDARSRQ
jgi:hypothetical protein